MELSDYQRIARYTKSDIKTDKYKEIELREAYYTLFREVLTISCDNCITDGIFRIQYYLKSIKKLTTMKTESNFKLKQGKVIYLPGTSMHITNNNLTDELAYMLLKKSRNNLAHFETYPVNEVNEFFGIVAEETIKEKEIKEATEDAKLSSVDEIMASNTKEEIIEKLGGYPHEKSWIKRRLAEQLVKKLEESTEITENTE